MYATTHHLPVGAVRPNAPLEGKPTRSLYERIQRYAHLEPTGRWTPQLELLLFPDELVPRWRDAIVTTALNLRALRARINYSEGGLRLAELGTPAPTFPLWTDCSAMIDLIYGWSIVDGKRPPCPMGNNWAKRGNTTTLMEFCQHITRDAARRGDLAVFHIGESTIHAILMLDDDTTEQRSIFSHGHQGAPDIRTLAEERQEHAGQSLTFLRVLHGG